MTSLPGVMPRQGHPHRAVSCTVRTTGWPRWRIPQGARTQFRSPLLGSSPQRPLIGVSRYSDRNQPFITSRSSPLFPRSHYIPPSTISVWSSIGTPSIAAVVDKRTSLDEERYRPPRIGHAGDIGQSSPCSTAHAGTEKTTPRKGLEEDQSGGCRQKLRSRRLAAYTPLATNATRMHG